MTTMYFQNNTYITPLRMKLQKAAFCKMLIYISKFKEKIQKKSIYLLSTKW